MRIGKAEGSKLCSGTESAESGISIMQCHCIAYSGPVKSKTKLRKVSFEISILVHDKKESNFEPTVTCSEKIQKFMHLLYDKTRNDNLKKKCENFPVDKESYGKNVF